MSAPAATATYLGLTADGKVQAVSHAHAGDTWSDSKHRSFCRAGSVSVRKMTPDKARAYIDAHGFVDGFMRGPSKHPGA